MKMYSPLRWMIAGAAALAVFAIAKSTTATSPPTSATPQMIEEAIQRSLARSEKLRTLGVPEQWGSEEPFVFNPNR